MCDHIHRLATHDYDFLYAIDTGDVSVEGLDLWVIRAADLPAALVDESIDLVELSLSGYIQRAARGDDSFVGIPYFLRRVPCHRAWFVRADSDLESFQGLAQGRVGLNQWSATGNTWARIAAADAGLDLASVHWVLGSPDGGGWSPDFPTAGYHHSCVEDRRLFESLAAGELDAVVAQLPPTTFYQPGSPIRRLIGDYVSVEREYIARTRVLPAHHLIGVRRSAWEGCPELASAVHRLLSAASWWWQTQRLKYSDTSPWVGLDIELARGAYGDRWQESPYGSNEPMLEALCHGLLDHAITTIPVDPSGLFGEYERVAGAPGAIPVRMPATPWHEWH